MVTAPYSDDFDDFDDQSLLDDFIDQSIANISQFDSVGALKISAQLCGRDMRRKKPFCQLLLELNFD